MKHILIADDEQPIINGLKLIINKYFHDQYSIIAEAHNGREAIELAETKMPDIILLDVNMPGINGIEAIRTISKHGITAAFILITAYEKFEIAQEALALGVCDYILKPVSKDRLELALNTASLHIEKLRYIKEKEIEYTEKEKEFANSIKEIFFYNLFNNTLTKEFIYTFKSSINISKPYACIILVHLKKAGNQHEFYKDFIRFIDYKTNAVRSMSWYAGCVVLLLPLKDKINTELSGFIAAVAEEFRLENSNDEIVLFPGTPQSILEISASWEAAKALRFSKQNTTPNGTSSIQTDFFEKEFYASVVSGKYSKAIQIMQYIIEKIRQETITAQIKNNNDAGIYKITGMAVCLFSMSASNYSESISISSLQKIHALWNEGYKKEALDEILTLLNKIHETALSNKSPLIKEALAYINNHFTELISLESAAEALSVSPVHLSRVMKEELGKGFARTLTETRLEHAKKILQDPHVSIKEASLKCGYQDPNYFARVFKNYTGITPVEYQEKELKHES